MKVPYIFNMSYADDNAIYLPFSSSALFRDGPFHQPLFLQMPKQQLYRELSRCFYFSRSKNYRQMIRSYISTRFEHDMIAILRYHYYWSRASISYVGHAFSLQRYFFSAFQPLIHIGYFNATFTAYYYTFENITKMVLLHTYASNTNSYPLEI